MKPHFTQRYGLPKVLHNSQRQSVTSPQLGQGNFTAASPGKIVLLQEVHVGIRITRCSVAVEEAALIISRYFDTHAKHDS